MGVARFLCSRLPGEKHERRVRASLVQAGLPALRSSIECMRSARVQFAWGLRTRSSGRGDGGFMAIEIESFLEAMFVFCDGCRGADGADELSVERVTADRCLSTP
jgi:hypothetical protein